MDCWQEIASVWNEKQPTETERLSESMDSYRSQQTQAKKESSEISSEQEVNNKELSCQLPLCADIISHSAATADQHMSTTHRAMELTVQCHKLSCEDLVMRRYALPWETSMLRPTPGYTGFIPETAVVRTVAFPPIKSGLHSVYVSSYRPLPSCEYKMLPFLRKTPLSRAVTLTIPYNPFTKTPQKTDCTSLPIIVKK
ncbi:uncharacterized protein LOC134178980 [Corticium candelabrum]|uniref:uncharacterized protein LOC134178980 n=1 Tax=Corticium candelabrum TaxID=121492 RepID=UPI002E2742F8|nr:uncharacterized protein LOC134178980 [Corticium candelabrum]